MMVYCGLCGKAIRLSDGYTFGCHTECVGKLIRKVTARNKMIRVNRFGYGYKEGPNGNRQTTGTIRTHCA